ncbi:MAG: dephospho-CoA kinase [Nitrospiraceae bacterium]|nr:dephospho-CoA kinase [Nitrospiraceae bacterium]
MRIYGLTGGIGSGKSEAARCFEALGVPVVDADQVAHEVIEPAGSAFNAVLETFGAGILRDGVIDRSLLADRVFGNPDALDSLNAITHPAIVRTVGERCAALAAQGHKAAIVEATLLGEAQERDSWLDGLILVLANPDTRLARLTDGRGMDEKQARRRIDAQSPPEDKRPLADWVVDNNGTIEELQQQVAGIVEVIRAETNAD